MRATGLLMGFLFTFSSSIALADIAWDDVISVPAVAHGPKAWLTCPKGTSFQLDTGVVNEKKCFVKGMIRDKESGTPQKVGVQGLLDIHFQPPAGYSAIAVGVIPELIMGATGNYYDPSRRLVAYRLTPKVVPSGSNPP